MTNEEARNYLLKWIEYATNPEAHPFIDEPCSDEEILEAMRIVAEALSNTELPSNLDEAANEYFEQYNYMPKGFVVDAFKAGAEWMAGQGYTKEGVAHPNIYEIWVDFTDTDIRDGDEVIVQIRKK